MTARLQPRICLCCRRQFQPARSTRRFCSLTCFHRFNTCTLPLDDMIASYLAGSRVVDLVEEYGFAQATIFEHLKRAGRHGFPYRPRVTSPASR
jgi:hypothetical protein